MSKKDPQSHAAPSTNSAGETIPVLTEAVNPDDFLPDDFLPDDFLPDSGPSLNLDQLITRVCDAIAEQIELELRLQLEARLNQALESAIVQIRNEVRSLLKTHLAQRGDD